MKKSRGDGTRALIVSTGLKLLRARGLAGITTAELRDGTGLSGPIIFYHFDTLDKLRDRVADVAIKRNDRVAIARLIADRHSSVKGFDAAKRAEYLAALA
jgi:AcrR family transcriptional regulator